jgi:hypothetical protein
MICTAPTGSLAGCVHAQLTPQAWKLSPPRSASLIWSAIFSRVLGLRLLAPGCAELAREALACWLRGDVVSVAMGRWNS